MEKDDGESDWRVGCWEEKESSVETPRMYTQGRGLDETGSQTHRVYMHSGACRPSAKTIVLCPVSVCLHLSNENCHYHRSYQALGKISELVGLRDSAGGKGTCLTGSQPQFNP